MTSLQIPRDAKLDFLRILAILECIFAHALLSHPMPANDYLFVMVFVPDTAAIFFMASGAIILNRPEPCGWKYVWKRIMTFLPEFVIFSALYVFMDRACGFYFPPEVTVTQQLFYMFLTPTWAPGWFILALIGLYFVCPLLSAWVRSATKRQVETGIALWMAATVLPIVMPHTPVDIPQSPFGTLFNYSGYMVIGYYLHRWPFKTRSARFKAAFFAVTVGVGLVFGYFLGRSGVKWDYIAGLTTGMSLNIVMVSLIQYGVVLLLPDRWFANRTGRCVSWLSKLSLGIYCCHWLFLRYWAIPEHIAWTIGFAVSLGLSIPLAWFMARIRRLCRPLRR